MASSRTSAAIAKRRWGLIADDLTGACDAAATFAQAGFSVAVALQDGELDRIDADLLAYSTATRGAGPHAARARVSQACQQFAAADRLVLFKKIDSVLRGSPLAETEQALAEMPGTTAILTPAMPAQGRIVVNQHLLITDPVTGQPAGSSIEIPAIRGVHVADASSEADLRRIAAEALSRADTPLFVGSAGLAAAVAAELATRYLSGPQPAAPPPAERPVLFVIGTNHSVTESQISALKSEVRVTGQTPATFTGPRGSSPVLVRLTWREPPPCDALAAHLGEFGALVVSGGDTTRYVLDAFGARTIILGGELAPGIPWGRIAGGAADGLRIVTKSGGFGDAATLRRILHTLQPQPATK